MTKLLSKPEEHMLVYATLSGKSTKARLMRDEMRAREIKPNWFDTLNQALESEGLLETWDITMGGINYGETTRYNALVNGECRHISIYRESDGRYERPLHYKSKGCPAKELSSDEIATWDRLKVE